jgi:hypothetical protein
MHLDVRNAYRIFVGGSESKDLLRILRQLLENNIKMNMKEARFENII